MVLRRKPGERIVLTLADGTEIEVVNLGKSATGTAIDAPPEDLLALDEALSRLSREHPRQHQVVMLRFFAGLAAEEAAELLGITSRTVERDWRFARASLYDALAG